MFEKEYYVYILTNVNNSVLYIGMTNNLKKRVYEHKNKLSKGFTKRYNLYKLVYFENTNEVFSAIEREKELKGWVRSKKEKIISNFNPEWKDLYNDI